MKVKNCIAFSIIFNLMLLSSSNIALATEKFISPTNKYVQTEINKTDNKILVMMNTALSAETAKKGDLFKAVVVDDFEFNNCIVMPKGSIVYGEVEKANHSKRFNRSASLKLKINNIQLPTGQILCLQGWNIVSLISSPYNKDLATKTAQRGPATVAGSGTSIPLNRATSLNGAVVYAISVGAAITTGFMSGIISPDYDKARLQSGLNRAVESSPIGNVILAFTKGKKIEINPGDCIVLDINKDIAQSLQQQMPNTMAQIVK